MTSLQKMYDTYLRPLNPEWTLPAGSARRLAVVNAFPLIVLAALITQVVLSYVFCRAEPSCSTTPTSWGVAVPQRSGSGCTASLQLPRLSWAYRSVPSSWSEYVVSGVRKAAGCLYSESYSLPPL